MNTRSTMSDRFDELTPAQQAVVLRWIRDSLEPQTSPLWPWTSYGLKHLMTSATGIYVTNNQFKEAMQSQGYRPVNSADLNWCFRISRKSPAFRIFLD